MGGAHELSATDVRALLERHGLAAHRTRGQNFLRDPALAAKLVRRAGVRGEESVLEIGTGLGVLTRALAERARRVVTLEVDAGLVRLLRAERALPENAELLHADALEADLPALLERAGGGGPVRVVANLPYAAAAPLLRRLLDAAGLWRGASLLLQREVAARLLAAPGTAEYGSLGVLVRLVAEVRAGLDLRPRCFYPVPRVVSTFVHLTPRRDGLRAPEELARVERVVRAAFAHRRKTIQGSLRLATEGAAPEPAALAAALERCGVSPRARAEALPPETWRELARALAEAEA